MTDEKSGRENESKQTAQRELVAQGMRLPGVAEALAVYGKVEPYVRPISQARVVVRYATGGNS